MERLVAVAGVSGEHMSVATHKIGEAEGRGAQLWCGEDWVCGRPRRGRSHSQSATNRYVTYPTRHSHSLALASTNRPLATYGGSQSHSPRMHHPLRPLGNPRPPDRIDPETDRKQGPREECVEPPAHLLRGGGDRCEVVVRVTGEEGG